MDKAFLGYVELAVDVREPRSHKAAAPRVAQLRLYKYAQLYAAKASGYDVDYLSTLEDLYKATPAEVCSRLARKEFSNGTQVLDFAGRVVASVFWVRLFFV